MGWLGPTPPWSEPRGQTPEGRPPRADPRGQIAASFLVGQIEAQWRQDSLRHPGSGLTKAMDHERQAIVFLLLTGRARAVAQDLL